MLPVPFVHLIPLASHCIGSSVSYSEDGKFMLKAKYPLLCLIGSNAYNRLPKLRDHLHDGCNRSLGLFNHDAVTALVGNEMLAFSR